MRQKLWLWLAVIIILAIVGAACRGGAETETAVCNFTEQTAVTLNLLDENAQPQRLVTVRYRLDDGPWQALPERVNERAIIHGGPGTYQIRLEKPGYTAEEVTASVGEPAAGSCELAAETVTLPMSLAVCPAPEPALLELEIESAGDDFGLTAFSSRGGVLDVTCTQTEGEICSRYTLPLNDIGSYRLTLTGLAGLGPMLVANEAISYTLRTSQITLRQDSSAQTLALTGANRLQATFDVTPDEIGCPLTDFRSLEAEVKPDISSNEPFPDLLLDQQNDLIITDLGSELCQAAPAPYPVIYEAMLPVGTPLAEVAVFTLLDGEWQEVGCALNDGRFLCTATLPNPFIDQPYAYKIVAAGEEYVGTSLPFDNLCLIFD